MKTYTFHVYLSDDQTVWRQIEMAANQTLHALHLAILDAFGFDQLHPYSFFMSGEAWDEESEYTLPEYREYGILQEELVETAAKEEEGEEEIMEELEPIGIEWSYEDESANYEDDEMIANLFNSDDIENFWQSLQEADEAQLNMIAQMLFFETEQEQGVVQFLKALKELDKEDFTKVIKLLASDEFFEALLNNPETITLDSMKFHKGQEFLYLYDYDEPWQFRVRVEKINRRAKEDDYPQVVARGGEAPAQYADRNV